MLRNATGTIDPRAVVVESLSVGVDTRINADADIAGNVILGNHVVSAANVTALEHLKFTNSYFPVNRVNESIWKFHERFGATRTSKDDVQFHYSLAYGDIVTSMTRYHRFLINGIAIQEIPN